MADLVHPEHGALIAKSLAKIAEAYQSIEKSQRMSATDNHQALHFLLGIAVGLFGYGIYRIVQRRRRDE